MLPTFFNSGGKMLNEMLKSSSNPEQPEKSRILSRKMTLILMILFVATGSLLAEFLLERNDLFRSRYGDEKKVIKK